MCDSGYIKDARKTKVRNRLRSIRVTFFDTRPASKDSYHPGNDRVGRLYQPLR
ncbi:hypothetical protein BAUCODRAFT_32483 [Baudoinia panamericana UAMH 10762]|uniref:Uncharacterized protein n=1 Tax=Baudoinia panamericana (strain UAMH 10762) TaxID=717646 RepID=M2LV01_BAUPA|nr:uncharacterized protein BAUCODRAFT_32483 [Baudoinia panamericana UAMH 10762]EMC98442.1 hypothetical protein BAUCODRAFT_32483 [Baudoinia panamericana UAMH 10762]